MRGAAWTGYGRRTKDEHLAEVDRLGNLGGLEERRIEDGAERTLLTY